jgi:protein phosphatase
MPGVRIDCDGHTDRGNVRAVNEDQYLIADLSKSLLIRETTLSEPDHQRLIGRPQGKLLMVADGMSGHGDGGVASTVAVDTMVHYVLNTMPWFFRLDVSHEAELRSELAAAMERCQARIEETGQTGATAAEMGTTLTMAYVLWPGLYVVHVGDSRCYLFRPPRLEQITRDHTVAQQMVDGGLISSDEAEKSGWRDVLWNAVGGGEDKLTPEVYKADLSVGDSLLLCTDGLIKHLNDQDLIDALMSDAAPGELARDLVEEANGRGGADNITAVVARFASETEEK